jgi:hypothetical protein
MGVEFCLFAPAFRHQMCDDIWRHAPDTPSAQQCVVVRP